MKFLLVLAAGLICQPAFASGGLNCSAEGEGVSFDVGGGVTHGMGSPLFSFTGHLSVSGEGIAADLGITEFSRDHVTQYWLDGKDLRLLPYRERTGDAPHGHVALTLRAEALGDKALYTGRYALTVFDMSDDNGGESVTVSRASDTECLVE